METRHKGQHSKVQVIICKDYFIKHLAVVLVMNNLRCHEGWRWLPAWFLPPSRFYVKMSSSGSHTQMKITNTLTLELIIDLVSLLLFSR